MRRLLRNLLFAGVPAVGVAALAPLAASCAADDDAPAPAAPDSGAPPASLDASRDGDAAQLDAGDAGPVTCTAEWCSVPLDGIGDVSLNAIWGSGPSDVWVAGTRGFAAHFDGAKWDIRRPKTLLAIFSLWGSGPSDVWAGNSGRSMFHWQGTSWQETSIAPDEDRVVLTMSGSGPDNVLALLEPSTDRFTSCGEEFGFKFGYCPAVYRLSDVAGKPTWRLATTESFVCKNLFVDSSTCASLGGLWVGASGEPWLVGQGGKALRPSGAAAVRPAFPASIEETHSIGMLEAVSGSSPTDVWAVGAAGAIRHFTGGSDWAPVPSPTSEHLRAIWVASPSEAWSVGANGTVLRWDGKSWRVSATPPAATNRTLYGVWGSAGGDVWAVGEHVLLRHRHDENKP